MNSLNFLDSFLLDVEQRSSFIHSTVFAFNERIFDLKYNLKQFKKIGIPSFNWSYATPYTFDKRYNDNSIEFKLFSFNSKLKFDIIYFNNSSHFSSFS